MRRQIDYGRIRKTPWGISESAYNLVDRLGNYQYKAFGVPGLGLKRGLADEVVTMAAAALRRLHLLRRQPSLVLAGSVFRADNWPFHDRIRDGVTRIAPGARIVRLDAPPVLGAAFLALDLLDRADREIAAATVRAALTEACLVERS